jgi:tyrosine phenol-lyase
MRDSSLALRMTDLLVFNCDTISGEGNNGDKPHTGEQLMNEDAPGSLFSVPYEIGMVRPLRASTREERAAALCAAGYNTELILPAWIYLDFKTDSGVSAWSTRQAAALLGLSSLESGVEMAAEGSAAFAAVQERFARRFGFPHVLPTTHGRAAERLWAKLYIKPGSMVPGNMLFPSTRFHIESNGAKVVDVSADEAHDLTSAAPFKGDLDIAKLAAVFAEHGDKISCVCVELCVNACGGHPVSLRNLRLVRDIAQTNRVPLFLDACRILENSYLIQQREAGCADMTVAEIARATCDLADGCTLSAAKDFASGSGGFFATRDGAAFQKAYAQGFLDGVQAPAAILAALAEALEELLTSDGWIARRVEQVEYLWQRLEQEIPLVAPPGGHAIFIDVQKFLPHISKESFPAEALAAFVYESSGVRLTKGPPAAPSQAARGIDLLRVAIPARRYLRAHLDDLANALLHAYAHRSKIKGLSKIETAGRAKFAPPLFAPLQAG